MGSVVERINNLKYSSIIFSIIFINFSEGFTNLHKPKRTVVWGDESTQEGPESTSEVDIAIMQLQLLSPPSFGHVPVYPHPCFGWVV